MKKRMLITTIVMVLVVAIALTTSSLAWFTMTATVNISEVSFGAITYNGAQLSVSELDRDEWGAAASIGSANPFDPAQGEPSSGYIWGDTDDEEPGMQAGAVAYTDRLNNLTLATDGAAPYAAPVYTAGAFQEAATVETTAAGNETAQQKVTLSNTDSAVFIGGFNVRNDGTAATTANINAVLNVGRANIINPNGSGIIDGDETYLYGTPNATGVAAWVADADFPYNEYLDANGYFTGATAIQANFIVQNADYALAGGLRVAVFTREWTDVAGTYDDEECIRRGIYGFSQYLVDWTDGWSVTAAGGGSTNALYVATPGDQVYSMTKALASATGYVALPIAEPANDGIAAAYPVTELGQTVGENVLPEVSVSLNPVSGTTKYGVEFIVIVWMDGWDNESVPAAGGGRVSLAYEVEG